ncbi:hypothetical protein SAMN04487761_1024 [Lachnospiraceae bacterium C7]|nr:hypothetical protein SAMN04487761_1024 [Lachnospiraceae bacterium C7]
MTIDRQIIDRIIKIGIFDVLYFSNMFLFIRFTTYRPIVILLLIGLFWGLPVLDFLLIRYEEFLEKVSIADMFLVVLLIAQVVFIMLSIDGKVNTVGNNYNYSTYKSLSNLKAYSSEDEAIKSCTDSDELHRVAVTRSNHLRIYFYRKYDTVYGYEILEQGGKYYNIGTRRCKFGRNFDYTCEETIGADTAQITQRNRIYPDVSGNIAWGVIMTDRMKDIYVDSHKARVTLVANFNGKNYYLWTILDEKNYTLFYDTKVEIKAKKPIEAKDSLGNKIEKEKY